MNIALVGLGYWGPNLLRVLNKMGVLTAAFDIDKDKLNKFKNDPVYTGIYFDTDWQKCLDRGDIKGVVIATPPDTHYNLATRCLLAGKHVFIEKPMTVDVSEAEKLIELSKDVRRNIMVGHIFLYVPEVNKVKEIIDSGELGDIVYMHASRLNLGQFQKANVVSDLAPHDISLFNYLMGCDVERVHANGYGFINKNVVEVAKLVFEYTNGAVCDLHLSWLDPRKKRVTSIIGTKKMLIYNMFAEEKIKVYDRGVDLFDTSEHDAYMLAYRHGDIYSPHCGELWEPLQRECEHFVESIKARRQPLTNGKNGLSVVKPLCAALESLQTGEWVCL